MFCMAGFMEPVNNRIDAAWSQELRSQVLRAVAESMTWLEHAGLIMPDPIRGTARHSRTSVLSHGRET
jgi:hypothetical protein